MGRDQRRHKRYDVGDVEGSLVQNLDARILNISLTGMAVETTALLKVGSNYHLRLPTEGEPLRLPAEVRWCRLVRTERRGEEVVPLYQAGIDFRDFLDEKAHRILKFIESHVVVELERRLFGRFKVASDQPVQLDRSEEFQVRKLSLSGMLVEAIASAEEGQVYDLELRPNGSVLEVRGRVAYVERRSSEGGDRYLLGLEFVSPSAELRRGLEAIIENQLE